MPPGHERNVVYTYRYLRAAMIALLLMLLFSVVYQFWAETGGSCWLGSISAYYYTPARTVFVGALCALGVCLIAYKGHSPAEDVLLNFSGFMAFVVAMVPTAPDDLCGTNAYSQTLAEIGSAVRNNIWSLIVVTVIAAALALWLRSRSKAPRVKPTGRTVAVSVACGAVLLVELILFLVLRERFLAVTHNLAAITMVVGVILVMVSSALRTEDRHAGVSEEKLPGRWRPRTYRKIYLVIAGALAATLLAALVIAWLTSFDHFIIVIEVIVIALFGVYWGVQTRELWHLNEPAAPVAAVARPGPGSAVSNGRSSDADVGPQPSPAPEPEVEGRRARTVAE